MAEFTPQTRFAVAVAVKRGGDVLAAKRPSSPDEELPGLWGLPAVTLRPGELPDDGVRRLGLEKLGARLRPVRVIGNGRQSRAAYLLDMTVYEAALDGDPVLPPLSAPADVNVTRYDAIDWLPAESFREAAQRGSLCCRVFLEAEGQPV
jgi:ADP-ribose pyrophosphatase YjhB (NUDIX family)